MKLRGVRWILQLKVTISRSRRKSRKGRQRRMSVGNSSLDLHSRKVEGNWIADAGKVRSMVFSVVVPFI